MPRLRGEIRQVIAVASNRPVVSAIIPTHNRRDVLAVTLRSIREQRDVELEIVVVDDGSSDGTCEWLSTVDDPRLRVLRQEEPRGVAAARDAGVELASAPYVAFCDDDDLWAPDKLAAQLATLAKIPDARWSCTSSMSFVVAGPGEVELVHFQRVPPTQDVLTGLLSRNVVPGGGSSVLAETDLVREAGGFRAGMAEDWDLWIRLGLLAPAAPVSKPLSGYRVWRTANSSRSYDLRQMEAGISAVRDRYAAEAKALGVEQADVADDAHLAKIALRCGLRHESFVRYSHLARKDPRKIAWAFAALVSPSVVDRATDRRSARTVPESSRAEVLQWMMPLLTEPAFS
jgi:glycosyltransferase involved in cell wall biosynthesis